VKFDKFVVKLKRHSSSYERDQGEQPRKVFIGRCQNSRSTCPPVEEQPQASGTTGSYDVSANPPSMHKIIGVREGIVLEAEKNCPKHQQFALKLTFLV